MKAQHIGERIRQLREHRGWSQSQLAKLSGIEQGTVSRIELGKIDPRSATLRQFARAFGIALIELLEEGGGEELPQPYPSLQKYLLDRPGLRDDEIDYLFRQVFAFGDPGPVTWDLLLATYRSARAQYGVSPRVK